MNLTCTSNLLFLPILISGHHVEGLLDTGASISLLKTSVAQDFNLQSRFRDPIILKFANGDRMTHDKEVEVNISFKGNTRTFLLTLVDKLPYPCLLGMDFLNDFDFMIISKASKTFLFDPTLLHIRGKGWKRVFPVSLVTCEGISACHVQEQDDNTPVDDNSVAYLTRYTTHDDITLEEMLVERKGRGR